MKLDPFSWLSIYVFVSYLLALDGFHIILEDIASGFVCLFVPRPVLSEAVVPHTDHTHVMCLDPNSLTRGEERKIARRDT